MRRDELLLLDMLNATSRIREHLSGLSREEFIASHMATDAVERQILILGEAANRVSDAVKDQHPEIPWAWLIQTRNFYAHGYSHVEPEGVWNTAQRAVGRLASALISLVPTEEEAD